MILHGIASTEDVDLNGYFIRAAAFDLDQRPPLFLEHRCEVGRVIGLARAGCRLFCRAETTDETAVRLNHFSVHGRVLECSPRGDGKWDCTRFKILEISAVLNPVNINCRITERGDSDPLTEWHKARLQQLDLYTRAFAALGRGLPQLGKLLHAS